MKTDKPRLGDMYVDDYLDDLPLNYRRRRYGRKSYVWVEAYIAGRWRSLGDPWLCITPPRIQMQEAIKLIKQKLS
jgi:hypothetical protein